MIAFTAPCTKGRSTGQSGRQGVFILTLFYPFLAFAASVFLLWGGRILALKCGFADKPGGRKRHEHPIPPIGGLVIIPVFALFSQLAGLESSVQWPLLAGVGVLLLMGAIDDAFPIKPFVKFGIMLLSCCFVVIAGKAHIYHLGNLFGFGDVSTGPIADIFTILAIALLMNAINMIDGVDGLAGGFCALVVLWMLAGCFNAGYMAHAQALSILMACLIAFMCFNLRGPWRKRASVFMGDSGALCMGLIIGWYCVRLSQEPTQLFAPATTIWIIALPVMDAFGLFIARSLRGLHPFNADRRHLHHRFIDVGISPSNTTLIMLSLFALTALIGLSAQYGDIPAAALFWSWLAIFMLHTFLIAHPRGYTFMVRYLRMKLRGSRG